MVRRKSLTSNKKVSAFADLAEGTIVYPREIKLRIRPALPRQWRESDGTAVLV